MSLLSLRSLARPRLGSRLLALLALAASAAAQESWIQPARFRVAPDQRVELELWYGKPGTEKAEQRPRDLRRVNLFAHVTPAGEKLAIGGIEGKLPVGVVHPHEPGLHTFLYRTVYAFAELEAPAYERFLERHGLEDVIAERKQRGESTIPGRDSYVRLCKTLLQVGDGARTGFDSPTELAYELVPVTDPFAWKPGEPFVVRALLQGAPVSARAVRLLRLAEPFEEELVRTDALGRASFSPSREGPYVLVSIFQRRASAQLRGDWEGLWASLSLALGPGEAVPAPGARAPAKD